MNLLPYYPRSWDSASLALSGLVVVMLALVALAPIAFRRGTLAERTQALAGGLCVGLAGALACGIAFLYLQSRTAGPVFFLAPYDLRMGFLCGIGLGALAALAVAAFVWLRSAAMVGLLLGTAIGLLTFRLRFGPTAGFGGEVGFGVGQEVGVMFGAAGGLLGGIVGHAISLAIRATRTMRRLPEHTHLDATMPGPPRWRWPLIGLLLGALGGTLFGALGVYIGVFQFLVPYNAQIPDVPPDTSPVGMLHNMLFGLGMFAVGGALVGCFLALQWMSSGGTGARHHGVWLGVGLVVALISGLSFGLNHRYVGGPLVATTFVHPDPVGGTRGLLIGLAIGVVTVGVLLLVVARSSRSHPRWRMLVWECLALVAGLLVMTLPFWYTSIFAISI